MTNKKAQAAMEFLMTYGWAILIVLAAIGALAYFGVLSPSQFLPEKCMFPSGLACIDSTVSGNSTNPTFTMLILNNGGSDMEQATLNLIPKGKSKSSLCTSASGFDLPDGEQRIINITCAGTSKGAFKSDLIFNYTQANTGLKHSKKGELIKKIN